MISTWQRKYRKLLLTVKAQLRHGLELGVVLLPAGRGLGELGLGPLAKTSCLKLPSLRSAVVNIDLVIVVQAS